MQLSKKIKISTFLMVLTLTSGPTLSFADPTHPQKRAKNPKSDYRALKKDTKAAEAKARFHEREAEFHKQEAFLENKSGTASGLESSHVDQAISHEKKAATNYRTAAQGRNLLANHPYVKSNPTDDNGKNRAEKHQAEAQKNSDQAKQLGL